MMIWSLRCFFPEPRKKHCCHHHQLQKTFSLVGWILLGQCTHNDDDNSIKAMMPAWFFSLAVIIALYMCIWKERKGPFLLVYCILLYLHACMERWTAEHSIFFSLLPAELPLMIILTKRTYEYCNVQFDYNHQDDTDGGGNDVTGGRYKELLHMVPHVHYFYFLLLFVFAVLYKIS